MRYIFEQNNQKISLGADFSKDICSVFSDITNKKVYLITGENFFKETKFYYYLNAFLKEKGAEIVGKFSISANPSKTKIEKGFKDSISPDLILSIGGGSVIDSAKKIKLDFYPKSDFWSIYTRYGSGSIVTPFIVYNNYEFKIGEHASNITPTKVYCSLEVINMLPEKEKVIAVSDIFAHATESLLSKSGSELSDKRAEEALSILGDNPLQKSDRELLIADINAALAESESLVLVPHAIGHYLTYKYNIPHGLASIIPLKAFISYIKNEIFDQSFLNYILKTRKKLLKAFIKNDSKLNKVIFSEKHCKESFKLVKKYMSFVFDNSPVSIDYEAYKKILSSIEDEKIWKL